MWYSESIIINTDEHHQNVLKRFRHKKLGHSFGRKVSGHNNKVVLLSNSSSLSQVLGSLFAPSQKSKKLSHHFRVCFELVFGILNAPRKIFLAVYEPILKLQGLQGVGFQGKNGFTKMVSNVSEIDCGFS